MFYKIKKDKMFFPKKVLVFSCFVKYFTVKNQFQLNKHWKMLNSFYRKTFISKQKEPKKKKEIIVQRLLKFFS